MAPGQDRHALDYNPALDGLRAVAVVLVFLFHARLPGFEAGFLGVDVFFVLSGYLITTILLAEIDRTGSVNWRRFVLRRLWRLAPALGALCLGMLVLSIWVWPSTLSPWLEVFLTLTYLSDVTVSVLHAPQMLVHSWSLSVEEHFYLLWPLVLLGLARREPGWVAVLILGLYLAASLWRIEALAQGTEWRVVYHRLDTRLSGLMFGAGLAALCRGRTLAGLARLPLWLVAVPVAGVLLAQGDWRDDGMLIWGVPAVELATAALILGVRGRGRGAGDRAVPGPAAVAGQAVLQSVPLALSGVAPAARSGGLADCPSGRVACIAGVGGAVLCDGGTLGADDAGKSGPLSDG